MIPLSVQVATLKLEKSAQTPFDTYSVFISGLYELVVKLSNGWGMLKIRCLTPSSCKFDDLIRFSCMLHLADISNHLSIK